MRQRIHAVFGPLGIDGAVVPYYIAPYIGSGTFADHFRPLGSDQPGWSAIDLRPDGGATLGGGGLNACLLHLPVANPDPSLRLIGDHPASQLALLVVTALNARLGTTAAPGRLDQVLASLLVSPPANGWKSLLPTHEGFYEVWLGGLLWRRPAISGGALPATDNFNRANENPLSNGGKWTSPAAGENALQVLTNQCVVTAAGVRNNGFWNADIFNSDHYSQVVIVNFNASGSGPLCRVDTGGFTETYYGCSDTAANTNTIFKIVAGVGTTIKTSNTTFAAGDTRRISASGSTVTIYDNGVSRDSVTDTAITGGAAGIRSRGTTTSGVLDDWQGDNVAAAAGGSRFRLRQGVGL